MGPRSHQFTFPGAHGDQLAALLELPEGEPRACALFAHCFTCGKDIRAARTISRALAQEGIGHSLGGAAVLAAAAHLPAVAAVATIGAPFDASEVRRLLASDLGTIERVGIAIPVAPRDRESFAAQNPSNLQPVSSPAGRSAIAA